MFVFACDDVTPLCRGVETICIALSVPDIDNIRACPPSVICAAVGYMVSTATVAVAVPQTT